MYIFASSANSLQIKSPAYITRVFERVCVRRTQRTRSPNAFFMHISRERKREKTLSLSRCVLLLATYVYKNACAERKRVRKPGLYMQGTVYTMVYIQYIAKV